MNFSNHRVSNKNCHLGPAGDTAHPVRDEPPMMITKEGWQRQRSASARLGVAQSIVLIGMLLVVSATGFWIETSVAKISFMTLGAVLMAGAFFQHIDWNRFFRYFGFFGVLFVVLVFISYLKSHRVFSTGNMMFALIAYYYLIIGVAVGLQRSVSLMFAPDLLRLVVLALVLGSCAIFVRDANQAGFYGVSRMIETEGAMHSVGLGVNISYMVTIAVIFSLLDASKTNRIVGIAGVCLGVVAVLGAAARGPALWMTLVILLILVSWVRSEGLGTKKIAFSVFTVLSACSVVYVGAGLGVAFSERIMLSIGRITGSWDAETFTRASSGRDLIWLDALQSWTDWIVSGLQYYQGYPHNQWLEWMMRFGLLGVALVIASICIFGSVSRLLIVRPPRFTLHYIIAVLFVQNYLISLLSLNLEASRFMFMGFGMVTPILMEGYAKRARSRLGATQRRAGIRNAIL